MRGIATFDIGIVTGYVMGVADAAAGSTVCLPSSVTVKQTKQVVFNYMKNHPDSWNHTADIIVIDALREKLGLAETSKASKGRAIIWLTRHSFGRYASFAVLGLQSGQIRTYILAPTDRQNNPFCLMFDVCGILA